MADECGCLYRSECKIHGGACSACDGTGKGGDGDDCSMCDGTGRQLAVTTRGRGGEIEGVMGTDKSFTVRTVATPCTCRWEKHPMSLMAHKDSTGCEVHGIFRPVGPPLEAHGIDIIECERAEIRKLRDLLGTALNWLEDPSAYHGTDEARDFDRRAREALGWSATDDRSKADG